MKTLTFFLVLGMLISSCSSKSGSRPTGEKTFLTTKIVGTRMDNRFILVDKDGDKKPDAEIMNASGKPMLSGDSVTLVLQQGKITGFYKL